jgi:hypothetical protein
MRWAGMSRRLAVCFTVACTIAAAATSFGQGAPNSIAAADSAAVADSIALADSLKALADSLLSYRFSPSFTNKVTADVSSVSMLNEFRTNFMTPWGSTFAFAVSGEEKNYRLTPQFEEKKLMTLSDLHTFNLFWFGMANYSDSRVLNRSKAPGGGFTDFLINDKTATLGSTYAREFGNMRTDLIGSGGLIQSERTFKNDKGIQSGVNGGMAYSIAEGIVVQGRAALRGTWDESSTVDSLYTGLGTSEDSVSTAFNFQLTDSIRFDATHNRYDGDRTFADQARGSTGNQQTGAENVFEETERKDTRNTTLSLRSRVAGRFGLTLTAMHDEQVLDYDVVSTRDSQTIGDLVTGGINYKMPWNTSASLQFETSETLRDYGPLSNSSLTDKRKRVSMFLSQALTKTMNVSFNGSTQLTQSFYLNQEESPLDQDQIDTILGLRISSSYWLRFTAGIGINYSNSEFVKIDSLQSSDNRTRQLWELRPNFTYFLRPNLSITQTYGLTFEYTDYFFNDDKNFLDRNVTFTNDFRYRPAKGIELIFEYGIYLHDNGSYLPDEETGERTYQVASEDRRDRTRIRVDYRVKEVVVGNRIAGAVSFFAENLYSRREEWTPGNFDLRDTTTDGQIQVGTNASYDWGGGRVLNFFVSRVKRFSEFGVDAAKDYWDA